MPLIIQRIVKHVNMRHAALSRIMYRNLLENFEKKHTYSLNDYVSLEYMGVYHPMTLVMIETRKKITPLHDHQGI
jgi:hypothetical protein